MRILVHKIKEFVVCRLFYKSEMVLSFRRSLLATDFSCLLVYETSFVFSFVDGPRISFSLDGSTKVVSS